MKYSVIGIRKSVTPPNDWYVYEYDLKFNREKVDTRPSHPIPGEYTYPRKEGREAAFLKLVNQIMEDGAEIRLQMKRDEEAIRALELPKK